MPGMFALLSELVNEFFVVLRAMMGWWITATHDLVYSLTDVFK